MYGWIRKFKRAALLSDQEWIKKIGEIEGKLIPGLEIKAFYRDQKDAAIEWLSKADERTVI